ncbi:group I intron-associated PD-(D/E)XK endonuclease [Roseimaritima multifibrata]|uniref:group I intron-associated PD-(D/E)XK endonuclease n=1 Tax=Roseimaritima multifibrata TaxID=1930274 RepID=UPI0011A1D8BD|nr:group I intron-associated PD-(D/E)XK endonuclease [Roseimaritima multifibrata]
MKNISFENMVACWLMQDGWQVFAPLLDHGHKTDLLISDGPKFYRIQVKTFESTGKNHRIQNSWSKSLVDVLVLFARNGDWGVVAPAFEKSSRRLQHETHRKFRRTKRDFLRQFHSI